MYNQYADTQINTFERRQREQQAAMQQMAQQIESNRPSSWVQVRRLLQNIRATTTSALSREPSAAHE